MKRRQNGFTLVELIIVIAVIGVLAAILIPVFSNVVKKANAKSALADARNAVSLYVAESTEQHTRGAAVPENITILVKKGGRYYAFGFNTAATESIRVSLENENGMSAQSLDALIQNRSFNVQNGGTYDPDATYTLADGAFYLVPYVGGVSQNTNVRGIVTVSGSDFMRLDKKDAGQGFDLNVGGDTAIYHGCLVNGTYETTGAQNNAAPTQTPTATATQAPTQAPTQEPTPAQFSVTFNANGGTGSMDGTTANGNYALPANGFTAPTHKHFTGWKANNDGSLIAVGDEYNVTAAVEFYAQWADDTSYAVVYNGNAEGVTGSMTDNDRYYTGDTATVLANNFAREGYTFKYFTTTSADSGAHYTEGDTITINGAGVTFYAQWEAAASGSVTLHISYVMAATNEDYGTVDFTVPCTVNGRSIDFVGDTVTFTVGDLKDSGLYPTQYVGDDANWISVDSASTQVFVFNGHPMGAGSTVYSFSYTKNVDSTSMTIYISPAGATVTDESVYPELAISPNIINPTAIIPVPYEDR